MLLATESLDWWISTLDLFRTLSLPDVEACLAGCLPSSYVPWYDYNRLEGLEAVMLRTSFIICIRICNPFSSFMYIDTRHDDESTTKNIIPFSNLQHFRLYMVLLLNNALSLLYHTYPLHALCSFRIVQRHVMGVRDANHVTVRRLWRLWSATGHRSVGEALSRQISLGQELLRPAIEGIERRLVSG